MKVALLQSPLAWHDPATNRAAFADRIAALPDGIDLVVLPEMFTTGFTMDAAGQCEAADGPTLAWLRSMARQRDAAVVGSVATRADGHHRNRLWFVHPDGTAIHYDKRHCFRMAGEHDHYTPGNQRVVVTFRGLRLLLAVCYDLRFPVWLRNRAPGAPGSYDALVCVANWPAARQAAWDTLLRARAIENLAWVVGVNRVGRDGNGLAYAGGSAVIDPTGAVAASAGARDGTVLAVADAATVGDWQARFPAWRDADPFALGDGEHGVHGEP